MDQITAQAYGSASSDQSANAPWIAATPDTASSPAAPSIGFMDNARYVFRRWASTEGRASRSEYWNWFLFYLVVLVGLPLAGAVLLQAFGTAGRAFLTVGMLGWFGALIVLFVPTWTVGIRRLHDTDRSGNWMLLMFVPYLNFLLIVLYCLSGSPGRNRYGDRPGGNLVETSAQLTYASPFAPTLRAPADGLASWSRPDPNGPVTPLVGGLPLEVIHRVDDWAQVRASNGWLGWVDGRRLIAFAPPPPPPAILFATGGAGPQPLG